MHGWFSHYFPERTVESSVVESAFLSGRKQNPLYVLSLRSQVYIIVLRYKNGLYDSPTLDYPYTTF